MNRKQIANDVSKGQIVEMGSGAVVMFTEAIKENILNIVVGEWNRGISIKDIMKEISSAEWEDDVTDTQLDYIDDNLQAYEQILEKEGAGEGQKVAANIALGESILIPNQPQTIVTPPNAADNVIIHPDVVAGKKKRQPRTTQVGTGNGKKVNVADVRDTIKEQIEKGNRLLECVAYIDSSVTLPDIPTTLKKPETDVLIRYSRELEAVQSKYISELQTI